ncbi:phosphoglycerate mutase family protein [Aspergillus clavatus NRRL 1]|uniref:Phosphoglycerate mutase family protein n=1 Tax=Aspergillus clavatus (strain ATCC 1007 / CBS 513.65 / DSM 816 / NCTC 3887 / NRRL 1 / QM 1276 / 107) TaxID=344612 RepID=A1CNN7_ASPCL|nr:phosphoglycerate mutase family protein [Aspergillus clavatus NRRL 1]EAW07258.1 phosphoglycerate mutase family protein [Aspergillus clavatus NRRL 1]
MPLDTIYLTRHGVVTPLQHRLNWTIDYKTGTYKAQFPTPTGNPADPTLTSHGVRQSHELAAHVVSPGFQPKPFRVYSSPFYRCLQTIQPTVEALKTWQQEGSSDIDAHADFDVRIENGLGEWFGSTSFFQHPPPADPTTLHTHFPSILPPDPSTHSPHLIPSPRGETIAQLHDRLATALAGIIADADALLAALEADTPVHQRTPKALLICSHAAPLIAMGRVLTGRMPADSAEEDFFVFTAGVSTFRRRGGEAAAAKATVQGAALAEGTRVLRPETAVPDWQGVGVAGGWECISNGDCSFLSGGAERGWHFNGEESFDTGPMSLSSGQDTSPERLGGKL